MSEKRIFFGRHLRLVRPGDEIQGPVTRMGLREQFNFVSHKQIAFAIIAKIFLLAVVMWIIYKN
jgi:hypothetical protein